MKHILVDARALQQGQRTGVGEYTYQVLSAMIKKDHTNTYYLFCNSVKKLPRIFKEFSEYNNVQIIHTRIPNKILHALLFSRLVTLDALAQKAGTVKTFDVVWAPNLHVTHISPGVRYLLTLHDLSFALFPRCFSVKQRIWHWATKPQKQIRQADTIFCPSQQTKSDINTVYHKSSESITVVAHGYVMDDASSGWGFGFIKKKYILFIVTIEPRKNIATMIHAYATSGLYKRGIPLIIAGAAGWKNKQVKRLMKQTPGVTYLGYVSERNKKILIANALIFVYPSLYEGFGLPLLDALAAGVPSITSARTSLPEVAHDAVYYVDPTDSYDLAQAMTVLGGSNKLREHFAKKGKERALIFSWEHAADVHYKQIHNI